MASFALALLIFWIVHDLIVLAPTVKKCLNCGSRLTFYCFTRRGDPSGRFVHFTKWHKCLSCGKKHAIKFDRKPRWKIF